MGFFNGKRKNKKNLTFSKLDITDLKNYQKDNKDNLLKEYNVKISKNDYFNSIAGIKNDRNNCYINSVWQCLININPITDYFLSKQFIEDLNIVNLVGSQGKVALNYLNFIKEYIIKNQNSVSPKNFIESVKEINSLFDGKSQQDGQEFLGFLIDILLEDTNKILKKPYFEIKDYNNNDNLENYANYCWNIFIKRTDSILTNYFYGQFKTTIYCNECDFITYKYEPFNILSLPINKNEDKLEFFLIFFSKEKHKSIKISISSNVNFNYFSDYFLKIYEISKNEILLVNLNNGLIDEIYDDFSKLSSYDIINNDRYFFLQRIWDSKLMKKKIDLNKGILVQFQIYIERKNLSVSQLIFIPNDYKIYDIYLLLYINIRKHLKDIYKHDESDYKFNDYEKEFKNYLKNNNLFFYITINDEKYKNVDKSIPEFEKEKNIIRIYINNKSPFNKINYKKADIKHISMNDENLNILDLINNLKTKEKLDEDNKWKCIKCKEFNLASFEIEIQKLPKILIIHYKKFQKLSNKLLKINKKIECDFNLDLNQFVIQKENNINYNYELISIIDHLGNMNSGHYISKVKNWMSKNWYIFNDKKFLKVNNNSIISNDNYILFFKRKDI